jgi:predicted HicB family RNase H-like nuclease
LKPASKTVVSRTNFFVTDIITYEGNTVEEIKISFEEAVDHYLEYCKETGKSANKPYSGTFNVRIGQELHRKAAEIAYHQGVTLNEFVVQSIKNAIVQIGVSVSCWSCRPNTGATMPWGNDRRFSYRIIKNRRRKSKYSHS